jgi:hypothetical protein
MAQSPPDHADRLTRLDARHRELLRALDELNARVEQVLREFGRPESRSPAGSSN